MSERPKPVVDELEWLAFNCHNIGATEDYITQLEAEKAKLTEEFELVVAENSAWENAAEKMSADSKRLDKLIKLVKVTDPLQIPEGRERGRNPYHFWLNVGWAALDKTVDLRGAIDQRKEEQTNECI